MCCSPTTPEAHCFNILLNHIQILSHYSLLAWCAITSLVEGSRDTAFRRKSCAICVRNARSKNSLAAMTLLLIIIALMNQFKRRKMGVLSQFYAKRRKLVVFSWLANVLFSLGSLPILPWNPTAPAPLAFGVFR